MAAGAGRVNSWPEAWAGSLAARWAQRLINMVRRGARGRNVFEQPPGHPDMPLVTWAGQGWAVRTCLGLAARTQH